MKTGIVHSNSKHDSTSLQSVEFDFKPTKKDEMPLRKGDIVEVLESYPDGWSLGINQRNKRQGMFPSDYLMQKHQIDELGLKDREGRDGAPPKDAHPPSPQDLDEKEPREISYNSNRRNIPEISTSGNIVCKASCKRKYQSSSRLPSTQHSSHTERGRSRDGRNHEGSYRKPYSIKQSDNTSCQSRDRVDCERGKTFEQEPLHSIVTRSNRDLETQSCKNFESKFQFVLYDKLRRKTVPAKEFPQPKDLIMFLANRKNVHLQTLPQAHQKKANGGVQLTESPNSVPNETQISQTVVTPVNEVKEKIVLSRSRDTNVQEAGVAEDTVLKMVLAMDRATMLQKLREHHLSSKGLKCFLVQRLVKALVLKS